MDSYFCKLDKMIVTFLNNLTLPQPRRSSSHDEPHEQTEHEASRGKVRYSFANSLWDLASNRGGKRQRFGSTSATDQGVDQDTRDGSSSDTGGLSDVPQAVLANSIQPILLQLQELDAEELLSLTRVETGGATLREG